MLDSNISITDIDLNPSLKEQQSVKESIIYNHAVQFNMLFSYVALPGLFFLNNDDAISSQQFDPFCDIPKFHREKSYKSLSCNPGQMSALITKACQTALMCHPGARLMIAMYKLDLEVNH